MESRHTFLVLITVWIAVALVSVFAPEMDTVGGDKIPITSWVAPLCALGATYFIIRWRKRD